MPAIVWTRTVTGKRMPVDADPVSVEDGGVQLLDPESDEPQAEVLGYTLRAIRWQMGITFYRTHFASCPDAAKFRRARA